MYGDSSLCVRIVTMGHRVVLNTCTVEALVEAWHVFCSRLFWGKASTWFYI